MEDADAYFEIPRLLFSFLLCLKSLRNRNNFRGVCYIHLLLNLHFGEIMSNNSNNDVH
jgi:hypothetical protein